MLKTKLTENYTGITITGDYEDFNELYDAISTLIRNEENIDSYQEYMMQNHLYAFLYDLRHAYQGDREAYLMPNYVSEFKLKYLNLKKKDISNNNVYYSFNYLITDLLFDMMLIRYFINKLPKKDNSIFNYNINLVNYFYSIALISIEELTGVKNANKIKKILTKNIMDEKQFIPQWFDELSIKYIYSSKNKKLKEFMDTADKILNYSNYKEYFMMKDKILRESKINNTNIDDIYFNEFPNEIKW